MPNNQGLSSRRDPRGEDNNPEFTGSEKEQPQSKRIEYNFFENSNNKQEEIGQLEETVELQKNDFPQELVMRISEHSGLTNEANKTLKDQKLKKTLFNLTHQLKLGNPHPGIATINLKDEGLKEMFEARAKDRARFHFRRQKNNTQI